MATPDPDKADHSKLQKALHANPLQLKPPKKPPAQKATLKKQQNKAPAEKTDINNITPKENKKSIRNKDIQSDKDLGVYEDSRASTNSLKSIGGDRYQSFDDDDVAFRPITFDQLRYIHEPSSLPAAGTSVFAETISSHALLNGMANKVQHQSLMRRESSVTLMTNRHPQTVNMVDEEGFERPHVPVVIRPPTGGRRSSTVAVPNLSELQKLYDKTIQGEISAESNNDPSPHPSSVAAHRGSLALSGRRRSSISPQAMPGGRRSSVADNRRVSLQSNQAADRRASMGGTGRRSSLADYLQKQRGSISPGAGGFQSPESSLGAQGAARRMSAGAQSRRQSLLTGGGLGFKAPDNFSGETLECSRGSGLERSLGSLAQVEEHDEDSADKDVHSGVDEVPQDQEPDATKKDDANARKDSAKGKNLAGQAAMKVFQAQKKGVTIKQLVNIKKWQTRATGVKDPQNLKEYANDELHYQLLRQNMENVVTELPLPMKITIFQAAFPIVQSTVQEYENSLGKSHHLTVEAKEHLEELESLGELLNNM